MFTEIVIVVLEAFSIKQTPAFLPLLLSCQHLQSPPETVPTV
jgi:hypothetical protein